MLNISEIFSGADTRIGQVVFLMAPYIRNRKIISDMIL
ncbi:hypothetical protein NYA22BAC_03494 (plasmid) [Parasphingorhabdus sp. NYA22]